MTLTIPYAWLVYASIPLTGILAFYATRWAWLIHRLCRRAGVSWWPAGLTPEAQWRAVTRLWFIAKAVYLWGGVTVGIVAVESRGVVLAPWLIFSVGRIVLWLGTEIWAYQVWLRLPPDDGSVIVHLMDSQANEQENP